MKILKICLVIPECDSPQSNDCAPPDRGGRCIELDVGYRCECLQTHVDLDRANPGHTCKLKENECLNGKADCHPAAVCTDTEESYRCQCLLGFEDRSPDPVHRPGRNCHQLENECETGRHDCHPNAQCIDTRDSFTCRCLPDFIDISPQPLQRPGRQCQRSNRFL